MSILFISGSPSLHPSRSGALLDHVLSRALAAGVAIERLSVGDIPGDDLVNVRRDSDGAEKLRQAVARSRAVVIATPVYNASVPGGLKALLDLLPERALHGKLVLPLASGGSAGHQLAIEYSLKPVLSALGGRHVLAGVFACESDVSWQSDVAAGPSLLASLIDRLDEATDLLLTLIGAPVAAQRPRSIEPLSPIPPVPVPVMRLPFAEERCSA